MRKVPALLFVLIAACGRGPDYPGPMMVERPPVSLPGKTNGMIMQDVSWRSGRPKLTVSMSDTVFAPVFIKAKRGQSLVVRLRNEGDAPHTFTTRDGLDEQVAPGRSTTIDVAVPDEGALLFYCRFHQAQGMQGAVYADERDTVPPPSSTPSTTTTTTTGSGGYGY